VYNPVEAVSPPAGGRLALDAQVISRAQQGDPDAFAEVVRTYEQMAFRVAYLIVRDESDARDVAQDAFVRAYRGMKSFDARKPLQPWLMRIVTNQALNSVRARRRRTSMNERYERTVETTTTAGPIEDAVGAADQARRVWQAVGALSPEDQTLLYLRYFLHGSERGRLRNVIEEQFPDLLPEMPVGEGAKTEA
jgi:RNA polymerase sigma-70 factor (ECF subfamily)